MIVNLKFLSPTWCNPTLQTLSNILIDAYCYNNPGGLPQSSILLYCNAYDSEDLAPGPALDDSSSFY